MNSTVSNAENGVIDWLAHPFTTTGSALNWVLFVGLLIIAAWFWNHILMTIARDV